MTVEEILKDSGQAQRELIAILHRRKKKRPA